MKNPQLNVILEKVKQGLNNYYQDQLEAIILYGSQARGDAQPDSDIDLLVILKNDINPFQEIDKTTEMIANICLEYDTVISWQFMNLAKFKNQISPYIQNVNQDGIFI